MRKNDIAAYAVDVWSKVADCHVRMKHHLVCAAAVLACFACHAKTKQRDAGTIHYIGRFTDDAEPRFAWSGSGIVARFEGTGIAVTLDGAPNWFETFVDGEPAASIQTGVEGESAKAVTIADKLPQGTHTVEVYRRTEALFKPTVFKGFTVTGGTLIPSEYPFAHRMLFIGDSISAGYGDQGALESGCHLEITTENALTAYPELTARALNAAAQVIAWSGKGMYRQFNDHDAPAPNQMPELFERTIPTEPGHTWDHTKFSPDVIVINLGTNDFSTGDPGEPYVIAYKAMLAHLRELYPRADIFCALGSMKTNAQALRDIEQIVQQAGDGHIHYFAFDTIDAADGYGCDYHPSAATQRKMADALTAYIRSIMSW